MMNASETSHRVSLRAAVPEDCEQIFQWRNDPWIVALGARGTAVDIDEHTGWFKQVIVDTDRQLHVVCLDTGDEAGVTRVDLIDPERAMLTIYLMQKFTGAGRGVEAIRIASILAFEAWPSLEAIHASILSSNERSIVAFRKAGFHACPNSCRLKEESNLTEMRRMRDKSSA
jgi:UDP-2,4-diacetamido-2,4,6-trideoxy-beta-L-altropyranose hydrolase